MKVFVVYDIEEHYIAQFDNYILLSKWFGKTIRSMQSAYSNYTKNKIKFIRSNNDDGKYLLYKVEID